MARRTIRGSRALVTGASGGIGRAIAIELARNGADLVLVARRAAELEQVAAQVRALGGRAEIVVGDVTDSTVRGAALDRASATLGSLDILVNNAGRGAMGRFGAAAPQRLRDVFELNFFAPAELMREALPLLEQSSAQNRSPIVVNIGSILGHRATPRNSEYCASKFALRGLSESLRSELAQIGIDLLLVSPGTTDSEFYKHVLNPAERPPWPEQNPVPAEKVARATVRAIRLGKREIIPSSRGHLLVWMNTLVPSLVDRVMRRYG